MKTEKRILIMIALIQILVTTTISGCSVISATSEPALPALPSELVSLALDCPDPCKESKLLDSFKMTLSDADKANGIQEKWCIGTSYIGQNGGTWYDFKTDWPWVKIDGNWNIDQETAMRMLRDGSHKKANGSCDWARQLQ